MTLSLFLFSKKILLSKQPILDLQHHKVNEANTNCQFTFKPTSMIKKAFYIVLFLFSIQVVTSCIFHCPEPMSYENSYNSVSIEAYDNSGFYPQIVNDTVYKNAFGLAVMVNFESVQISELNFYKLNFFNTAMALNCENDNFTYPDPISHVEIFITDTKTGEINNATEFFMTESYMSGQLISLEQFFIEREEWHDGFQFQLVNWDSIPNSAIFTAKAYLESGQLFLQETEQINFFD